ncbi:hypothetical protein [Sphingomonas sp. SORGH_AS_0879]|uniref:hypothetical protein n=1 Tax=Sphingomonas sp. SORGH_AS_0879 TaxID=3041790 RepID=UPI0027883F80|nr:hypothetical protein [Sphingomonas sp. SORGH_AS_0879]MDQ1228807.1 hypothetical protein [Sphingomonas sp. SORGH_AS_0879]
MNGAAARAVMAVALPLMRQDDRCWAHAMGAEFEEAERDGQGLRFAMGCLGVAARRLTGSGRGWHFLTRHGVALAIILPFALFHLGCALRGLRYWLAGGDPYVAALSAGDAGQRLIAVAYRTWSPWIALLLVVLGTLHIVIAWRIACCQWRGARHAMIAAILVVAGLLLCIAVVHPTPGGMVLQAVALAVELLSVPILAAWQARHNVPIR